MRATREDVMVDYQKMIGCLLAYIINEGEIIESDAPEKIIAGEVVRLVYPEEDFKCGSCFSML